MSHDEISNSEPKAGQRNARLKAGPALEWRALGREPNQAVGEKEATREESQEEQTQPAQR